ncbi:MAG TPA: antibiotic biosynthesis monooxygenase [Rhodobacteraceae bacterium]|nr:antibiotic biosynthesis monooxygenase [Paracoccaceae bacterium]
MIAVIFEVDVDPAHKDTYLEIAAALKASLEQIDGFISVERFQSLSAPGKLLSLSFFRDAEAVARWRNLPEHRAAQEKGRAGIFRGYRLRVAEVMRDYTMDERHQAPDDSRARLR